MFERSERAEVGIEHDDVRAEAEGCPCGPLAYHARAEDDDRDLRVPPVLYLREHLAQIAARGALRRDEVPQPDGADIPALADDAVDARRQLGAADPGQVLLRILE